MIAYEINVDGVVQGVGFRYFTQSKAKELGVNGSVENLNNGQVRVHIEGDQDKVYQMLKWLHDGPDSSRVKRLEYSRCEIKGVNEFEIIRKNE